MLNLRINFWTGFFRLWLALTLLLLIPIVFFLYLNLSNSNKNCKNLELLKEKYGQEDIVVVSKFVAIRNIEWDYRNFKNDQIIDKVISDAELGKLIDKNKKVYSKDKYREELSKDFEMKYEETYHFIKCKEYNEDNLVMIYFFGGILISLWFILYLSKWILSGFRKTNKNSGN